MITSSLDFEGNDDHFPSFVYDDREQSARLLPYLLEFGIDLQCTRLKAGDYLLYNSILIERKTSNDFIQSLVSGRLFAQCRKLQLNRYRPLILIEGNLYETHHNIDVNALKGAQLSIATAWNIPILYSADAKESAELLYLLYKQGKTAVAMPGPGKAYYKPRRQTEKRIQFLQGLPDTGPVRASRLLDHFGSIEKVITADINSLRSVDGIGKKGAERIREFLVG